MNNSIYIYSLADWVRVVFVFMSLSLSLSLSLSASFFSVCLPPPLCLFFCLSLSVPLFTLSVCLPPPLCLFFLSLSLSVSLSLSLLLLFYYLGCLLTSDIIHTFLRAIMALPFFTCPTHTTDVRQDRIIFAAKH